MEKEQVLSSIAKRGNGEIYLGVVGAVRTGKSTFIKRFIENLVVPNITDEYEKKHCLDEIPQSAEGKTIMTTEPKFVPSNGATIKINEFSTNIKLVDCVGYVIPEANGFEDEDGNPRMVKSPWFEERESYLEAEEKVIRELKEIGKPFIVILNSIHPTNSETRTLAHELMDNYDVPVIPISAELMNEKEIMEILKTALYEFPVLDIKVNIPEWVHVLPNNHVIKTHYMEKIKESVISVEKLKDIDFILDHFSDSEYISKAYISELDAATGIVTVNLESPDELYTETLKSIMGDTVTTKAGLLKIFATYQEGKEELDNLKTALKMAKSTGYGIVYPTINELKLETPELVKQGNRYGVKLKAVASSIHLVKVDVESTFEPIIGSELQSKELINHLMKDYEVDPSSIWKSEIFGRSLEVIVQEGIQAKLSMMPDTTRYKLKDTLTKIVNKGSNTLIAIVF